MPNAVLNLSPNARPVLELGQYVLVRTKYAELARSCIGHPVLLYQSGRGAAGVQTPSGYFGTAIITGVFDHPNDPKHRVVTIDELVHFDVPRPLVIDGPALEPRIFDERSVLRGRRAAEDLRIIDQREYRTLVDGHEFRATSLQPGLHASGIQVPKFVRTHQLERDPKFTHDVYVAYGGLCAISGLSLLNSRGECGLQAAHIYPYHLDPLNLVSAGILLAPSWHARYDLGLIVINDDYSWSALVEDIDTMAINNRQLIVPPALSDRPDVQLLRRNRVRLGLETQ